MNGHLTAAWESHQAGRYADAARAYHALLQRHPDDPAVLHLFGVLHHQCGYPARAAELIGRAAALRPDFAGRSIADRRHAGDTTKRPWPICLPYCRRPE